MKKIWNWCCTAVGKLFGFLASEEASTYFKLVDDAVENSSLINDTKYQNVIRTVIDSVNGAVRYSLKTEDEKKRIIVSLAVEELAKLKLKIPEAAVKLLVDILFEKTKKQS